MPAPALGTRPARSSLQEAGHRQVLVPAYRHMELSEHNEDACRSILERFDIRDVRGCLCCNLHCSPFKAMAPAEAPELYDPTDVVLKHIPRRPFPLPQAAKELPSTRFHAVDCRTLCTQAIHLLHLASLIDERGMESR